jgi:hypothetical protein
VCVLYSVDYDTQQVCVSFLGGDLEVYEAGNVLKNMYYYQRERGGVVEEQCGMCMIYLSTTRIDSLNITTRVVYGSDEFLRYFLGARIIRRFCGGVGRTLIRGGLIM